MAVAVESRRARRSRRLRPPNAIRRARLAVTLCFALTGVLFGAWIPRLPDMKAHLDLSTGTLGLALLAPSLGALAVMAPIGRLCARSGSGRVATIGFTGFALFAALVPWSGSLPVFVALMVPWGASIGGTDVAMNAQGVHVERMYGRPILSGFHAWFSIGGLIGAGIGSAGAALGVGVGPQQVAVAALSAALQLGTSRWFLADGAADVVEAAPDADSPLAPDARRVRLVLVILGIATIAALVCEGAVSDWSAVLLRDDLGASAGVAGLGFSAFSATMAIGRLTGDRVVHRFGAQRTVLALGGVGALGIAAGLAVATPGAAIAGFGLLGIGLAVMFPVAISSAAKAAAAAGTGIAAVTTTGYTAFLIGPTVVGQVADHVGLRATLWGLPVLAALAAALIAAAATMAARVAAPTGPPR